MADRDLSLPQRSQGGLAALDIFYRSYNDFYFYVEDEEQENLYFAILRTLFPDIDFAKIFPLGGKSSVLAHSKSDDNQSVGKRVYLLDKDFDDLLGTKEDIKGVYYLDAFCIENYFLDEDALIEIVLEAYPKRKRDDIRVALSLHTVVPMIGDNLKTLFALFFLVQAENLGIANCSQKPEKFCKNSALWEVCPDLVAEYSSKVSDLCKGVGTAEPADDILNDPRLESFRAASANEVVSGKFWLSMLFHYVKSKYSLGSITFDSFVFRVASKCSFEELSGFVEEVRVTYPE